MSDTKSEIAEDVAHEARNRLEIAHGYGSEAPVTSVEGLMQREAVEEFLDNYKRLERALYETGKVDQSLLENMESETRLYDKKVRNALNTVVYSIKAVDARYSIETQTRSVEEIFEPIERFGELQLQEGVGDEEISRRYEVLVSTKICDHYKHAVPEAQKMTGMIKYDESGRSIKGWIADDGEGLSSEDLEDNGTGTRLILESLDKEAEYRAIVQDEISDEELPKLPIDEGQIGGLFEFKIPIE